MAPSTASCSPGDSAVEVVDPGLEGDGEVDEVAAAAADQHALRLADAPHPDRRPPGEPGADRADDEAGDRDDECAYGRDVHGPRLAPLAFLTQGEDDGVARAVVRRRVLPRHR